MRNRINDRFFQKGITQPVVASVTLSVSGQSIVITTISEFEADYLLQKKSIWEDIFSQKWREAMKKDIQWGKIVLHRILTAPFSTDKGLFMLKNEIETFNSGIKVMKTPAWLSSEENRQKKIHASAVITVENAEKAKELIGKNLCIARCWLKAEKYTGTVAQIQCKNCQKFGHFARMCKNNKNIS